jgi:hypothetical protein
MFFVNFVPEEGRWYCFAPTATGVQRIPVSMDASPFEAFTVAVDEQAKEVVNRVVGALFRIVILSGARPSRSEALAES